MQYDYKEVEVRRFRRKDRNTGKESIVSVSNRNNFSVEEHIRLLNLNDPNYEYIELVDAKEKLRLCVPDPFTPRQSNYSAC